MSNCLTQGTPTKGASPSMQLTTLQKEHYADVLNKFSLDRHEKDLIHILKDADVAKYFSVQVSTVDLLEVCAEMSDALLWAPLQFLAIFNEALVKASIVIYEKYSSESEMILKMKITARMIGVPEFQGIVSTLLPKLEDYGRFRAFTGTVARTTEAKVFEYEKDFRCTKCGHEFVIKADFEQFNKLSRPSTCPNIDGCGSSSFVPVGEIDSARCRDYQEVRVREQVQKLAIGRIPQAIWIALEDDLVNTCKPGDDVIVFGTVLRRWKPLVCGRKPIIEMAMKANHLEVINDRKSRITITEKLRKDFDEFWANYKYCPLSGRNNILRSFCPQLYGLYTVKLAVTLVLTGGVAQADKAGTRTRGESHLLLVGDPGTGKSQLLKYASKFFSRSVLTTGIGCTSAGLTVSAIKKGGVWQLEAGALVLADGGVCCIDEFNSISEYDRASILEAMEQQSLSVAKAGLVCKLESRCTVLAATNPKGSYDPLMPINVNVGLASPLLSRFDLVLILLDLKNEEWDCMASNYILKGNDNLDEQNDGNLFWDFDKLQAYLHYIKGLKPTMNKEAFTILQGYYLHQREASDRNAARTTVRMLESLIRLSEAHARLMLREEVTIMDAVYAVVLMESSRLCFVANSGSNSTQFPENAEEDYRLQVTSLLRLLDLEKILKGELDRLVEKSRLQSRPNSAHDPPDLQNEIANLLTASASAGTAAQLSSGTRTEDSGVICSDSLDLMTGDSLDNQLGPRKGQHDFSRLSNKRICEPVVSDAQQINHRLPSTSLLISQQVKELSELNAADLSMDYFTL